MDTIPDINLPSKTLPGGTVTFLFTDIEGSTQLLHKLGDQYTQVLALQRQTLRSAFERWQGCEVDTQGDAFFVAFSRASDAISAAAQAQESLAQQAWPAGMMVKVRMGLHTGEAKLTQEGYVGMDVHRASRICSTGHGGQILVSPSTAILVMNSLPERLRLRDLGEHRLKDLSYPEHLYQLDVPGLPGDFPALKSLNALPNNLPVQLTSFVGRQDEIEQLKKLLAEVRLITITGPGGSGKSRLSLQAAADLIEQFSDGVWFVPLSTIDSVDEVPTAIANSLHFRIDTFGSSPKPSIQLADYLSTRSMLLVLDNFEHLLAGAGFLIDLLVKAPQLKVLLTSRECLNIPEEWVYAIPGLSYPHDGHKDGNGSYTALVLFQERARQTNPTFSLSARERPYASTICRLVGGMPLAIELAAPWTALLTCREIAQEIEHNLDFLSDTLRGMPEGHRSLRAVFEHSWKLLNKSERKSFCNLAVFEGGFDRRAAQQVAGIDLPMLLNLVNKSLVQRGEGDRYQMHALLHQFASERLSTSPDNENAIKEKHSRYYLNSLEQWQSSPPGEDWLKVLEKMLLDEGNLREMIRWILINWKEEEARRALDSIEQIYLARGFNEASNAYQSVVTFLQENGACLETDTPKRTLLLKAMIGKYLYNAILGNPGVDADVRECLNIARSLNLKYETGLCVYTLGISANLHGNYQEAIRLLEEACHLISDSPYVDITAGAYLWLGDTSLSIGENDRAKKYFGDALKLSKQRGVGIILPYSLDKMGLWADETGNFKQGLLWHQEALESFRELGVLSGLAYSLSRMSVSARELGDFKMALQYAQEGYDCFKTIGHRWGIAISLCRIGYAELALENYGEAQNHFSQGLKAAQENQMPGPALYAMIGLGIIESRQGDPEWAVEILTFAINHPVTPPSYKPIAQKELALLEDQLGHERFLVTQTHGQALEFQAVMDRLNKPYATPGNG